MKAPGTISVHKRPPGENLRFLQITNRKLFDVHGYTGGSKTSTFEVQTNCIKACANSRGHVEGTRGNAVPIVEDTPAGLR